MKRPFIVTLGFLLIMGAGSQSLGEDTGVMRGSDDGATKRILKTKADGTLLIKLANEQDPEVVVSTVNIVPKWNGVALIESSLYDNGNVGIGTTNPGGKLEVAGQVKITGGLPGAGKVLTSDAAGLADWQTSVTTHGDGADCAAGNYPLGVDAGGVVQGCTADDDAPDDDSEVPDSISINSARLFAPAGAGNVGISSSAPSEALGVQGNIAVSGTVDGVAIAAHAASAGAHHAQVVVVPAGAVAFFNQATCPSGWSEMTAARGRYLVGLPIAGTLAGTAGTALTNLANRAVGQHSHTITDPGHGHSYTTTVLGNTSAIVASCCGAGTTQTGSNATGLTVNSAGAVAGTNAPYIQYLVCEKL